MDIFNYLPKRIDLTEHFKSIPEESRIWIDKDLKWGHLTLKPTDDFKHFRLCYVVWDYEGAVGYFPFTDEQIYLSQFEYTSCFDGGFVGDNVEELAGQMYGWLKQNNYI